MQPDADTVADNIRAVAAETILPRWRTLADHEISEKSGPGDLVTVADTEAEQALAERFAELTPGVPVIGEESVASEPGRLRALVEAPYVWVVDPIDGTRNFVAGSESFGVMVAFVSSGETEMGWIYHPAHGTMVSAARGAGAFLDGKRISCTDEAGSALELQGIVKTRFLDPAARALIEPGLQRVGPTVSGTGSAAVDYTQIIDASLPYVFYWQTHSWDHAAGSLIVEEANGKARRLDGSPYRPVDASNPGLLVAAGPDAWSTVHAALLGDFALF